MPAPPLDGSGAVRGPPGTPPTRTEEGLPPPPPYSLNPPNSTQQQPQQQQQPLGPLASFFQQHQQQRGPPPPPGPGFSPMGGAGLPPGMPPHAFFGFPPPPNVRAGQLGCAVPPEKAGDALTVVLCGCFGCCRCTAAGIRPWARLLGACSSSSSPPCPLAPWAPALSRQASTGHRRPSRMAAVRGQGTP